MGAYQQLYKVQVNKLNKRVPGVWAANIRSCSVWLRHELILQSQTAIITVYPAGLSKIQQSTRSSGPFREGPLQKQIHMPSYCIRSIPSLHSEQNAEVQFLSGKVTSVCASQSWAGPTNNAVLLVKTSTYQLKQAEVGKLRRGKEVPRNWHWQHQCLVLMLAARIKIRWSVLQKRHAHEKQTVHEGKLGVVCPERPCSERQYIREKRKRN